MATAAAPTSPPSAPPPPPPAAAAAAVPLREHLASVTAEPHLASVLTAIAAAVEEVAAAVRTGLTRKCATFNAFGDEQLEIDVIADEIIVRHLRTSTSAVCVASSEERPTPFPITPTPSTPPPPPPAAAIDDDGDDVAAARPPRYGVAYDPLDGSSVIGSNFAVGSLFAVFPGDALTGAAMTGRDAVASVLVTYGPRTMLYVALRGVAGVAEALLVPGGSGGGQPGGWSVLRVLHGWAPGKRLFAPGNLRATGDNPGYRRLVDAWLDARYTLRYTGALVADVVNLLIAGGGVFCNAVSAAAPAKLRLLHELIAVALVVEAAGGVASTGGGALLDVPIVHAEVRCAVCVGGGEEVRRYDEWVGPAAAAQE